MWGAALEPPLRKAPGIGHKCGITSKPEERTGWKLMFLQWSGPAKVCGPEASPLFTYLVGMYSLSNNR